MMPLQKWNLLIFVEETWADPLSHPLKVGITGHIMGTAEDYLLMVFSWCRFIFFWILSQAHVI